MGCTYPGTQRKTTGEASKGFPVRKLLCVSVEGGGAQHGTRKYTSRKKSSKYRGLRAKAKGFKTICV